MLTKPMRCAPAFAATDNRTVPDAVALAPDVTEIHAAPVEAVQLQPLSVVTCTDRDPPAEPIESLVRLRS